MDTFFVPKSIAETNVQKRFEDEKAQRRKPKVNIGKFSLLYWLNDLDDERKLVTSFSLLPKIFVIELLFSRRTLIFSFCFSLELNFGVSLYFLQINCRDQCSETLRR
jgi:hypothetical protein